MSEASQILRRYVITAFELPAAELTTTEFCAALAASERIGGELAAAVSSFLRECDERKFSPPPAATLNAATRALELISLAEQRLLSVGRASARAGFDGPSTAPPRLDASPAQK